MANVGNRKGRVLDDAVKMKKPMKALELGTYCGYSSIRIARLLPKGAKLITLEVNKKYQDIAKQLAEFAGISDKIEFKLFELDYNHQALKKEVGHFDFVFMDHHAKSFLNDIHFIEKNDILKKGSAVVSNSLLCEGAEEYREYMMTDSK
jgi:catechol O-methyltransferase